jgi:arginyl-tRNA synthetase
MDVYKNKMLEMQKEMVVKLTKDFEEKCDELKIKFDKKYEEQES